MGAVLRASCFIRRTCLRCPLDCRFFLTTLFILPVLSVIVVTPFQRGKLVIGLRNLTRPSTLGETVRPFSVSIRRVLLVLYTNVANILSGCRADVDCLAVGTVSSPVRCSIHCIFAQHNRPSAFTTLLHKHRLLPRNGRDLKSQVFCSVIPAILLYHRCHLSSVHNPSAWVSFKNHAQSAYKPSYCIALRFPTSGKHEGGHVI